MDNTLVYTFTPDQVQKIVDTLMQFPANKVYETIKLIENETNKQSAEFAKLVAAQN